LDHWIDVSLDIAILGADGSPRNRVSIATDDHWRLMQLTSGSDSLLQRLQDYYADAEFLTGELDELIRETRMVRERCHENESLFVFLSALVELAEFAKRERQPLLAIAD
jgi:hypothetical protein